MKGPIEKPIVSLSAPLDYLDTEFIAKITTFHETFIPADILSKHLATGALDLPYAGAIQVGTRVSVVLNTDTNVDEPQRARSCLDHGIERDTLVSTNHEDLGLSGVLGQMRCR